MPPCLKVRYVVIGQNFYEFKGDFLKMADERFFAFSNDFEQTKKYAIEHEICVRHKEWFICVEQDGTVKVYSDYQYVMHFTDWGNGEITELVKHSIEEDKIIACKSAWASIAIIDLSIAVGLACGTLKNKRVSHKGGIIYKVKEFNNAEVKLWNVSKSPYAVSVNDKGIAVLRNSIFKKYYRFPSTLYPMPNNANMNFFHEENTKLLADDGELGHILADFVAKLGCCYSNVEQAIALLEQAGYTKNHTVEQYCGWCLNSSISNATHHSWLVVDGESVIDFAWGKTGLLVEHQAKCMNGEFSPFNKSMLADDIYRLERTKMPFVERWYYGVVKGCCYVGCVSTAREGKKSWNDLMEKHPDHIDYNNVNRQTGKNELNDIYYGRYGR